MDNHEREMLNKMLKDSDFEDKTNEIRNIKHSELIKNDVNKLLKLRQEYNNVTDLDIYKKLCYTECSFLAGKYKKILDKLVTNELELSVMYLLIKTLRKIEDGIIDQNEGSVEVGKILKKIYIDKAIVEEKKTESTLSWNTYKKMIN
jgi:hypothetical protein